MVVYECKKCGWSHPAPVRWDSKERFDAIPIERSVGDWGCPWDGPDDHPVNYAKADLAWEDGSNG